MKVDIALLSPTGMVEKLNAEGCDITAAQYKSFLLALTKIGVRRFVKQVVTRLPGGKIGSALLAHEAATDDSEHSLRKLLRTSFDSHLNQCFSLNRWFEDPAEAVDESQLPLER